MRLRTLLAAGFLALGATAALAGASSSQLEAYQPDPALRTAPKADLESRVRRACAVVQARLQNTAETGFERPCGCYAKTTLRSLDASEIEAYRATGYFNDSARAKALNAIDACKLQRPV
ncbi:MULTISPECIES: hypothetical protein [Methylobacterium]|jgi:hypothetical protein|uniref:hypothetical protein n=1 Tax=Methylobacterium TaxID=407 RepID=UPI0008EFB35C|nr:MULTISPECIES: hypothetical protein [Methylobacterium]MBK3399224.1 hypothetical protein [Methylobacterium ajmalii]MBK3410542.1 hypothetical protein [Methylobacterium ajmalii]MBK3420705.1 hypothetical protein [Methylobacterium ajmalii]MBZ6412335.1 hypothetical protein [Methylobacterium sp.]SFE71404.1 hypothetical protein SAMN04487844_105112 [Methylobacterium sp. yr596]